MTTTVMSTAAQVWRSLCEDGGLELVLKNKLPGRDADLESTVREELGVPDSASSLEAWLAQDPAASGVTVERLLVAVLRTQAGFAAMTTDILATLINAEATRATQSLSIAFTFEGMKDPIVQTLEQFRQTVERTQRVLERRPVLPPPDKLWRVTEPLRSLHSEEVKKVFFFPEAPTLASTGHAQLDSHLAQVCRLIEDFRALGTTHVPDRAQVRALIDTLSWQDANASGLRSFLFAVDDFWDVSAIEGLQCAVAAVRSGQLNPDMLSAQLADVLDTIDWGERWVESTVKQLLDVLALPVWKRRHELYAVWVGTRLLEVVRGTRPSFRFSLTGGLLSFAFGGSRLGIYEHEGQAYEIWAELRSDLVGASTKRKSQIQPDFRVVKTGLLPAGERTTLVLECKHYLHPSRANFTAAAKDYARSCPQARVYVVNHGEGNEASLRAALNPQLQVVTTFLCNIRPDDAEASRRLSRTLHDALSPDVAMPEDYCPDAIAAAEPAAPQTAGEIVLEWDDTLHDIDLALLIPDEWGEARESICFSQPGALDAPPFARLEADIRQGPGIERIHIAKWHFDRYTVVATNYSKFGRMTPTSLKCQIHTSLETKTLLCPMTSSGERDLWLIADLVIREGIVHIVPIESS